MKPGDTVFLFHWGFIQKGSVVGIFGDNVLIRLFSRNGEPSVIKLITPAKKVTPVVTPTPIALKWHEKAK